MSLGRRLTSIDMSKLRCRELDQLHQLLEKNSGWTKIHELGQVKYGDQTFSIPMVSLGREGLPTLIMVAGVHGLERIGSEVVLAYLQTCLARLKWDDVFANLLDRTQLVFIPIVNPIGIARRTRSNGRGVDLMRNAPLDADEPGGFIHRGQSLSSMLPFFRGNPEEMEHEAQILCDAVEKVVEKSPLCIAVDVHSGFGSVDRFWFPFSHSKRPCPHLAQAFSLKQLLDASYPNHFYVVEPMARQYTIHGDLWDHLYLRHFSDSPNKPFIPWTLEMGSWIWVKKNPLQVFSPRGYFDPVRPHRRQRILRRHLTLFDFLHRSLVSSTKWWSLEKREQELLQLAAEDLWYR